VRAGQTVRITVAGATVLTLALAAERRPQRAATVRRSAVIRPDFVEENLGTLTADPMRLRQILLNLLSNACKFTKRGEVKLKAKGVTNGGNWIELADCDTEIGMTPEQTGEAVRGIHSGRFVDRAVFRGTGLGFAISRKLARMTGGDVTVASGAGKGSVFTVRLPVRTGHALTPIVCAEQWIRGRAWLQRTHRPQGWLCEKSAAQGLSVDWPTTISAWVFCVMATGLFRQSLAADCSAGLSACWRL
jgi:hypothetical protein